MNKRKIMRSQNNAINPREITDKINNITRIV